MDDIAIEKCKEIASVLKILSNPQRLLILYHLAEREKTTGELAEICKTSQPAVSQYLTRMRLEKLITPRRERQSTYYRIKDPKIVELIKALYQIYST